MSGRLDIFVDGIPKARYPLQTTTQRPPNQDGSVQFTISTTCPAAGCVYCIFKRNRKGYETHWVNMFLQDR